MAAALEVVALASARASDASSPLMRAASASASAARTVPVAAACSARASAKGLTLVHFSAQLEPFLT